MSRDPELAPIIRQHPQWEVWRGISGLLYARRRGSQDKPVVGESPEDLNDMISRAERLA